MAAIPPRSPHRLPGGDRRRWASCPPAGQALVLKREEPCLWVQVGKQAVLIERRVWRLDPVESSFEQQQDVVVAEVKLPNGVEVLVTGRTGRQREVRGQAAVAPRALGRIDDEVQPFALRCRS